MFPLHPQLFQIKSHGQQEQLGSDVGPAAGEESAEAKVVFEQSKCPLHLDGAAQAQMDAPLGSDALSGFRTLLPKSLLQTQLFQFLNYLRFLRWRRSSSKTKACKFFK